MSSPYSLDDLRRAVAALPPGSSVTLPREVLVEALKGSGSGDVAPAPETPDRLMKVGEAAARLGVTRRYVYAHADQYPFTKRLSLRVLRFSDRGLEKWLARSR
jgi:predicted DNA-binding transcriptional regulator AlpA